MYERESDYTPARQDPNSQDADRRPPADDRQRLLDGVRERIRYLHYSYRTEQAYVDAHVLNRGGLRVRNPQDDGG